VSDLDIDGQGLTQVGMSLAQANSDAYERYQALEQDSGSVTPER
jgi:hypothetical protein